MNLIIGGVFAIVVMLIIKQIAAIRNEWEKRSDVRIECDFDCSRYSDTINEMGKNAMGSIKKGIVKKQLLPNDALKHDSNMVLDQYIDFINCSSMYKYLMSAKEQKYNGED